MFVSSSVYQQENILPTCVHFCKEDIYCTESLVYGKLGDINKYSPVLAKIYIHLRRYIP